MNVAAGNTAENVSVTVTETAAKTPAKTEPVAVAVTVTETTGETAHGEAITKAKVVEHKVGDYDVTDNPETHMQSAIVPKFCLRPKHEKGTYVHSYIV